MATKQIKILVERADIDHDAVKALLLSSRSLVSDEPTGQLSQQVVEILSRALLLKYKIKMGSSHNLSDYFELLRKTGNPVPSNLQDLKDLTQFALRFRYIATSRLKLPPLDRKSLAEMLDDFRSWVISFLGD